MNYVFKTDSEVLLEFDFNGMTQEEQKLIKERFGSKPVKKLEFEFADGVTVNDCGDLYEIDVEKVLTITITLRD
jgi:hypothetical protein